MNIKVSQQIKDLEIKLLKQGKTYKQISDITGLHQSRIQSRNRLQYKIDIAENYRQLISKNGLPKRQLNKDFCNWFCGFFDGQGHFIFDVHKRPNQNWYATKLGIQVKIRKDDQSVINYIYENLRCGRIDQVKSRGTTMQSVSFSILKVQDLVEVMIPIFDNYSLRTKKKNQYLMWKELLLQKYISSLGGKTKTIYKDGYLQKFIKYTKEAKEKRHPKIII